MSEPIESQNEDAAAEDLALHSAETEPTMPDDSHSDAQDANPSLQEQYEAAMAERDEAKDQLLRTYAELENSRRRARNDLDAARKYAVQPLAKDLLPSLDNLRRAIDAAACATEETMADTVRELNVGVSMVLSQIEGVFAQHEITPVPGVGNPVDPNVHEVLQQVPSEEFAPGSIMQEVEKGYMIRDRVLRPAKVIVSSGPA